jgi:hypothetical protein
MLAVLAMVVYLAGLGVNISSAQENPFLRLETMIGLQRPPQPRQTSRSSNIKNIQVFGERSGIAYTNDTLFRTDNNGETWREIALPRSSFEKISGVLFFDKNSGWAILANPQFARLSLAKTNDGGISWEKIPIIIKSQHLPEANLDNIEVAVSSENGSGALKIRLTSSSNFVRQVVYQTENGGQTWEVTEESSAKKTTDIESFEKINGENIISQVSSGKNQWFLTSNGNCEGFKTGCWQETKIFTSIKEITPPEIKELARIEKEKAKIEARDFVFAQPPNGSTRISLNRGFDKCTAATAAQMQIWWDNSPFYDANIYISGRNRGCTQPQLTASWVDTVAAQGWGLIPTIVGYQSPCSTCTTCARHSSDAVTAEQQGRGEADIAIADANALGLTQGTVLYYDMERYDDTSGTGACSTPTKAFLKGWTDRLHELGYISGVYGSPTNAVGDWLSIPAASRMDAVWLARWDNVPSVWVYSSPSPVVPNTAWANHQRIKQWQAPHNETWGGVTFNIDGNIADGPVAGLQIAKNKPADFDGDGKSDLSVYRPETGVWYVLRSTNGTFTATGFGLSTDVITPGDYDGDGKTDYAVYRDGVWYILPRTAVLRVQQFGGVGDIPVPADYDGDGRTDIAVFRPTTGVWYIANSFDSRGTSFRIEQFGINGDKPVVGDYDGDGKADLAVWRPTNRVWYLLRSTAGFTAIQFGISTDKPAQGDYDGDGRTDLAVYRDGVWYLQQSTAGFAAISFGLATDKPAPGDFDGDGKWDLTVYRPETGVWYVLRSQAGFTAFQFGVTTDKPVTAAYIP